jgi:hypothetical protein
MFTLNPFTGLIDAVAEPENIKDVSKSEIADFGISLRFLPIKNQ